MIMENKEVNAKHMIKEVMYKWNFPVISENEHGVVFRYRMHYVQTSLFFDDDFITLLLTLSGVFTPESEREMIAGLKTCGDLNGKLPLIKLYIDKEGELIITSEILFCKENLETIMKFGLDAIMTAKTVFSKRYAEISREELKVMEN